MTRERIATLMVSPTPFSDEDRHDHSPSRGHARLHGPCRSVEPGVAISGCSTSRARSHSPISIASPRIPYFDFTAPTDRRPFFFNMLKPRGFFYREGSASGGVVSGNLRATRTLLALAVIAGVLVLAIVGWPLLAAGRPAMPTPLFASAIAVLRDHRLCVHADTDRVPAAFFRIPGPPDLHVLDHPVPHDSLRRIRQLRIGGDRSGAAAMGVLVAGGYRHRGADRDTAVATDRRADDRMAPARPHAGRRGSGGAPGVCAGLLLSDWAQTCRPPFRSAHRLDVGREWRVRGHGVDPGRDGIDVARVSTSIS